MVVNNRLICILVIFERRSNVLIKPEITSCDAIEIQTENFLIQPKIMTLARAIIVVHLYNLAPTQISQKFLFW